MNETVKIPVYSLQGGVHRIEIYQELPDGTFRRTGEEPLRAVRDMIAGLGASIGELVSVQFDRSARAWRAPTILASGERPQSVYEFLRGRLRRRRLFVFSKPSLSGRLVRFDVQELQLKSTIATQILTTISRRYCEAMDLWLEHGADSTPAKRAAG